MTQGHAILILISFIIPILTAIIISIFIIIKKIPFNKKNFLFSLIWYLPDLILSIIIIFVVPNDSNITVISKVLAFIILLGCLLAIAWLQNIISLNIAIKNFERLIKEYENKS